MTGSLGWYARRLRGMSAAEVAGRVLDKARRTAWERRRVGLGDSPPALRALTDRAFASPLPAAARAQVDPVAAAAVVAAADRLLAGEWTLLGTARPDIAAPDWFLDPVTGRRAPHDRSAFRIDHRDESVTGNVKAVWELSRHHHLTVLAAAYWLTGDDRYAEAAALQLCSWWSANPFLSGVHWTSGIELGVRLISWVWIRRLLDGWSGVGDLFEHNADAVRQIRWHEEILVAFPSRGSSANNHLIAEAAGLLAAANAFPWYAESATWRRTGTARLERSFAENTFASGLNRELATDYHRFVTELVLLAGVEADVSGSPLSEASWGLLTASFDAAAAVLDAQGRPPRQGDGDEGRGLVVDDPDVDPWQLLLDAGAAVVGARSWWPTPTPGVLGVAVSALASHHLDLERPDAAPTTFDDAGLTLLRTPSDDGPEIWCRCDGGPHGFLSIAAHAHADALSVEVRYDGVDVLADPGTYCYHGEPEWRGYFRSTLAHNTVEIDGQDQSVSGGPFMWTRRTDAQPERVERSAGPSVWVARHDGYGRLDAGLVHRRRVRLDRESRSLEIRDTLTGGSQHAVRLLFHLGPDVDVELSGSRVVLAWRSAGERVEATMDLPADLVWSEHRGETDPPLGWYSPRFGQRVPSTTLVGSGRLAGRLELHSQLSFPPNAPRRRRLKTTNRPAAEGVRA